MRVFRSSILSLIISKSVSIEELGRLGLFILLLISGFILLLGLLLIKDSFHEYFLMCPLALDCTISGLVGDLASRYEAVITPVEQIIHDILSEAPERVQVIRLLCELGHVEDQSVSTFESQQDHLEVLLASLEGQSGPDGVHDVVRTDEEVG